MDRQQELDHSSPIVQRVLRLRERMAQSNADAGNPIQAGKSYPWQMWQKSDFSAYGGDVSEHDCK